MLTQRVGPDVYGARSASPVDAESRPRDKAMDLTLVLLSPMPDLLQPPPSWWDHSLMEDDPEKRIAELEHQLAQRKRIAELERQLGEARATARTDHAVEQPPQFPDAQRFAGGHSVGHPWQGAPPEFGARSAVGPQPSGAGSRRQMPRLGGSRRGARVGLRTIVGLSLSALLFIPLGAWWLSRQHSGAVARVEVAQCTGGKLSKCTGLWPPSAQPEQIISVVHESWTSTNDVGHDINVVQDGRTTRVTIVQCHSDGELADGEAAFTCTGVSPPSHAPLQAIEVKGATQSDVGHNIDVHVHESPAGRYLTADKDPVPYLMFGSGCVAAVCAVVATVRRLRYSRSKLVP